MKWESEYLGLHLRSPLIAGASPLTNDPDWALQARDAGAGAIVMHSVFEEQISLEEQATIHYTEHHEESYAEALSYFPHYGEFASGLDPYLRDLGRLKKTLDIPVIASLNASQPGSWVEFATRLEEAGADALELNLYFVATRVAESPEDIESRMEEIARAVSRSVSIPVAVKLSPYFTSTGHLVRRLITAGARGVVLFNRFYQPDLDLEELQAVPRIELSDPSELRLRLHWLAILWGQAGGSLSCSGGVHSASDLLKALFAGADTVQLTSALLRNGPGHLRTVLEDATRWLHEHGYQDVDDFRGSLSLQNCPDPWAYERGNYIRMLSSWRPSSISS
jgi:dihydroorotate dehydrogenase (fumarate)